jgi:hypothetical protein
MEQTVILTCPACGGRMEATRLRCLSCDVTVEGHFAASPFERLTAEQQEFAKTFLAARGNIKLVERQLGMSYPTERNRLDAVRRARGLPDRAAGEEEKPDVREVLDKLESGVLSADKAIESLG